MTNPLTGDHDAVLQVSAGTINRLLASMHQNEWAADPVLPCLPHSAFVRVGDDPATRVDGVQGVARVQLGVPQVHLIHLAQDRVNLQVVLRAQVTTSSGSTPFPEFVHGTLRAQYGLREIGGVGVPGGTVFHPPRFHFDVDPASVVFTSFGDTSQDAAITRQAVGLLRTAFTMQGGHPMLTLLVDRKLITLVAPDGSQALAVGLELGPGDVGTEQPRQITRVFTGGRDVAVAASADFVRSLVIPHLQALEASVTTVHFDLVLTSVDYSVDVTSTSVSWALDTFTASGVTTPCGALDLAIDGRATTTSIFPDITFTIRHRLIVAFNPGNQVLGVVPKGEPDVQAHVGGIGPAESAVEAEIAKIYKQYLNRALLAAFPRIASAAGFKEVVAAQLKMTDDQAAVTIDSAEFSMDGFIVRGSVSLSSRIRGSVQFAALDDLSGYSAFLSWFPGGRITAFAWKWEVPPPAPPHTVLNRVVDDRFAFQPPEGMPGLPPPSGLSTIGGRVCLYLQGSVIDPVSGAEVQALAQDCYSAPEPPILVVVPIDVRGVGSADAAEQPLWLRMGTDVEVGISEAGRAARGRTPCNTLLYYITGADAPASLDAIIDGIDRAERDDAGLQVLAFVPEGRLADAGAASIRSRKPQREALVNVVEDIGGNWARKFDVHDGAEQSLRLITADGREAWSSDGPVDAATVGATLREHLTPSDPPDLRPPRPGPAIGRAVPRIVPRRADDSGITAGLEPPMTVCFALSWAESSHAELHRLDTMAAENGQLVVVVLTGASSAEAADAQRLASQVLVLPDPDRTITDQHAIWMWPTTLSIDADGVVASATVGIHPFDDDVPTGASESGAYRE